MLFEVEAASEGFQINQPKGKVLFGYTTISFSGI